MKYRLFLALVVTCATISTQSRSANQQGSVADLRVESYDLLHNDALIAPLHNPTPAEKEMWWYELLLVAFFRWVYSKH
jgi:hypothetical protein